jgi:hypothetical protein
MSRNSLILCASILALIVSVAGESVFGNLSILASGERSTTAVLDIPESVRLLLFGTALWMLASLRRKRAPAGD